MIAGFVAANSAYVRRVPGGVVRRLRAPERQTAVVIGGGSGHYPAFGGLVGRGLAHGAAMGNLFASPSTEQILSVAREAENGGGVILSYGNYAGDVLNFDAAERRLRNEGVPCETVLVTDDIASAGPEERGRRRGIAGGLAVYRIASAAAESGYDLAGTADVARRANDRTRSFGVAFSGCTLPGASHALFEVPEGRMALGLGIHGEPGIAESDIESADGLAELLVSRLLAEVPDGGSSRVVPLLNGLGALKYEELFVVYRRIAELLTDAGLTIVDPHVGEFCTSFDMAGGSLTLLWLDPELEGLWATAADAPAYRRGTIAPDVTAGTIAPGVTGGTIAPDVTAGTIAPGVTGGAIARDVSSESDEDSRRVAAVVVSALGRAADTINAHLEELGDLDAIAGDGDHGIGMQRGVAAALAAAESAAEDGAGAEGTLTAAAAAWADRAGGTSGALWGLILRSIADALGNRGIPKAIDVARGWNAAADVVMSAGKASPGDKTMVDVLVPFGHAFATAADQGAAIADAWSTAAAEASSAAAATAHLLPRMGRARTHAQKSLGSPDPGARSLALVVEAVARLLESLDQEETESA
jgi:dihydroxyacetone kinase